MYQTIQQTKNQPDMNILFYTKQLSKLALLLLLWFIAGLTPAQAEDEFTDYLPKYRKFKSHYQIDQIKYDEKRTIIHFRFVAQESGTTSFYNGSHSNSWYMRTPPRMRGLEIQFKLLDIINIAINNQVKRSSLGNTTELSYQLNRGDVVTCEVHFVRIPNYIRMLDLIDGKDGALDENKLNCFDIMIKTKENPLLGTPENMESVVGIFEQSFNYIKPKTTAEPIVASTNNQPINSTNNTSASRMNSTTVSNTNTNNSSTTTKTTTTNTATTTKEVVNIGHEKTPEPIDYMPNALASVTDFKCNTRVYLPNVIFDEDEIKFTGRVKALQNIRVIAEYLLTYKDAKVNLYGHTDIHGSPRKNLDLSRERAMAVKRELVEMGIDAERISVFFFGGTQPLSKYKNGGTPNRRVEVEPVCTGK